MLLAGGKAVPISSLHVGEMVLATDTRTGKTQPEAVAAVLVHHDTDLYDLKVRDRGRTSVIDTTSNHLFWIPGSAGGGRWAKAASLKYGTHLRTPDGGDAATVAGGWIPRQARGWMWDLTIPGNNDHDFYIDTTAADVLVHNCGDLPLDGTQMSTDETLDAAQDYLGEGYSEPVSGSGRFVSEDGTRVVRMGDSDITGAHGPGPHMNFEELAPNPLKSGKMMVTQNSHVILTDP